jgi:hypothetical protein
MPPAAIMAREQSQIEVAVAAVVDQVVLGRSRIRGSAVSIEQRVSYVREVRNGKGVHVQVYFSWNEALEAAGLSE